MLSNISTKQILFSNSALELPLLNDVWNCPKTASGVGQSNPVLTFVRWQTHRAPWYSQVYWTSQYTPLWPLHDLHLPPHLRQGDTNNETKQSKQQSHHWIIGDAWQMFWPRNSLLWAYHLVQARPTRSSLAQEQLSIPCYDNPSGVWKNDFLTQTSGPPKNASHFWTKKLGTPG